MKNKENFIVTKDKETSDRLIAEGFRLIAEENGKFTFENKSSSHFFAKEEDLKKVVYTNILTF